MAIATGARLGPYEVTAKLGEGGMGEVWRATDTRLRREVAIKVLPAAFVADKERLARFEREAQLLAQLQHPNIASVFGLEESDGTRALVMELVEGEDLAQRVARGAIPIDETIAIARQIAEALEAAHEHGIVHRDLKPANVKVTADGTVKVLDFGLAKALDPASSASAQAALAQSPTLMDSPTLTSAGTQLGVILGTAAYMSPEQARGGAVDKRTDIWAFGVLVYEMLTGRSLFAGETVSDTLAGVLKSQIDLEGLPAETPPTLRRVLLRCLERNPKNRLHDIADARLELGAVSEDRAATPDWVTRRRSLWTVAAAAVLLVGAGLAAGRFLLAPHPSPSFPLRLQLAVPDGLSLERGVGEPSLALSPDGRRLALAVAGDAEHSGLLVRDLDQYEPRLMPGTAGATAPFFSPDGEWLGYATGDALYKIAVTGGSPVRLVTLTRLSRGATWGRDGFIYFTPAADAAISRVAETGGAIEAVTKLDAAREERSHRWPELTSDGKALVFSCDTTDTPNFADDARIEAVRLGSGERHVLVEAASQARLLADDLLLYFQDGNAFALALDRERLAPRGKPVLIEQQVFGSLATGAVQAAVSRRGDVVWLPGDSSRGSVPVWRALDGTTSPTTIAATLPIRHVSLAPDGLRAALSIGGIGTGLGTGQDIWIADLGGQTLTRISFNENADSPIWTPDSKRVVYRRTPPQGSGAGDSEQIVWRPADGSGAAELLVEKNAHVVPESVSPDGNYLIFSRREGSNSDLWLAPLHSPGSARPFQASQVREFGAAFSPDGRWIAYMSADSGDWDVYVRPFPEGSGRWQISSAGGYEPHWSADGAALFYRAPVGRLMGVTVEAGAVFRASAPREVLSGLTGGPYARSYGVAPDGKRFLVLPPAQSPKVHGVNYADDWGLRARRLLAREQ